MCESMFENLKTYFPTVGNHAVSYKETDDFELTVLCDDGSCVIYDDLDRTIRMLPPKDAAMTEAVWRREFGTRLRKRMTRKGYTQQEFAELIGTSQTMLSNYINGHCVPSFYIVDKIARALDCSIDDLRYT